MDQEGNRQELYYIPDDPAESNNLIGEQPEIAKKLERMVVEWGKTIPAAPPEHCISSFR